MDVITFVAHPFRSQQNGEFFCREPPFAYLFYRIERFFFFIFWYFVIVDYIIWILRFLQLVCSYWCNVCSRSWSRRSWQHCHHKQQTTFVVIIIIDQGTRTKMMAMTQQETRTRISIRQQGPKYFVILQRGRRQQHGDTVHHHGSCRRAIVSCVFITHWASICIDYVPALCTDRMSHLPIGWSGEASGL